MLANKILSDDYYKILGSETEDKITKFLEYMKNNKIPQKEGIILFGDGTKMGSFWHLCKQKIRCNKQPYSQLLTNPLLKQNYEQFLEQNRPDEYKKVIWVRKFKEYMQTNSLPKEDCQVRLTNGDTNYKLWSTCKKYKLCQDWPFSELLDLDILKQDYEQTQP